jgi:ABC-type dipeptide/oligopeptide/nickel transport system permease component
MWRTVALRLLDAIPTLLLVLTLVFVTMRMLPGDPAIAILGEKATIEQLDAFRERMGLNLPLWLQYLHFLRDAVTLDFGKSFVSNFTVAQLVQLNLPYTIELTIASTLIGTAISVPIGVAAAVRRGEAVDSVSRVFSLIGYAVPDLSLIHI